MFQAVRDRCVFQAVRDRYVCVSGSEKQSLRDTMGLHTGETCMVGELRQTVNCERELTSYRTATLNPESGHTLIPLGSK